MKINEELNKWLKDPSCLEEDGCQVPDKETIKLAIEFNNLLQKTNPNNSFVVVPCVDGGISFERYEYLSDGLEKEYEYTSIDITNENKIEIVNYRHNPVDNQIKQIKL